MFIGWPERCKACGGFDSRSGTNFGADRQDKCYLECRGWSFGRVRFPHRHQGGQRWGATRREGKDGRCNSIWTAPPRIANC